MKKKLLLFDLDGTLITTRGVAVSLMVENVSKILRHPIQWHIKDFVGNTDRNILFTLFRRNGSSESVIEDFVDRALENYLKMLPDQIKEDEILQVLPGAKSLLSKLHKDDRFALALLTGNVKPGAEIKLEKAELMEFFPIGAFGDDAIKRESLPPFAVQRAEKYYNCFFEKEDTWIVGDSINDIKCARANQLRSLAVASGRTTLEELETYHPTRLIPDLKNSKKIIQTLLQA